MKKALLAGCVGLAALGLVILLFRGDDGVEDDSSGISSSSEVTQGSTDSGTFGYSGGTSLPMPPARPVERPDISTVGRKVYDTGITNDSRVQQDSEGRNLLMEPLEIARGLHSAETSPEEDLEYIDQILGFYRLSFERNPIAGDNQMVMEALRGANPGNLVVFPSDHPSLDSSGQLLDRWGNPYFFHALSGTEMEIFSAGPDGEMNTVDDIAWTQRDGKPLSGAELEDPQLNAEP